jgi:hypothetical protein
MKWVCPPFHLKFEGVSKAKITIILHLKIGSVFEAKS